MASTGNARRPGLGTGPSSRRAQRKRSSVSASSSASLASSIRGGRSKKRARAQKDDLRPRGFPGCTREPEPDGRQGRGVRAPAEVSEIVSQLQRGNQRARAGVPSSLSPGGERLGRLDTASRNTDGCSAGSQAGTREPEPDALARAHPPPAPERPEKVRKFEGTRTGHFWQRSSDANPVGQRHRSSARTPEAAAAGPAHRRCWRHPKSSRLRGVSPPRACVGPSPPRLVSSIQLLLPSICAAARADSWCSGAGASFPSASV